MARSLTEGYLNFPVCQLSIGHMKAQKKDLSSLWVSLLCSQLAERDNKAPGFTRFSFSGEFTTKGIKPAISPKNERSEKKLKKEMRKAQASRFSEKSE